LARALSHPTVWPATIKPWQARPPQLRKMIPSASIAQLQRLAQTLWFILPHR